MKDDYLWDKIGKDSEIEKLENALQVFRPQESNPPQIEATVFQYKKESSGNFFPVFRALAACLTLVFISVGFWMFFTKTEAETTNRQFINIPFEKTSAVIIENKNSDDISEKTPEIVKNEQKKPISKIQKSVYKPKIKPAKNKNEQVVKLTQEEKAAYEQLMLALSITSSKLKIVKDKVQNLDDQTAIYEKEKLNKRKK